MGSGCLHKGAAGTVWSDSELRVWKLTSKKNQESTRRIYVSNSSYVVKHRNAYITVLHWGIQKALKMRNSEIISKNCK